MQTCSRAALSVICFANASSPKGRAEKPVRTAHLTNQSKPHANLFACCSFRHGLRRATFLREEGFGFPHKPNLSLPLGEMSRSDREGLAPSLRELDLPQAKTEGVLPNWQDSHEICPDANLFACCSFRHGLRRATFLREEGFGFPRNPNLSLPLGEMSRSDREGWLPCEGAGFAVGKD